MIIWINGAFGAGKTQTSFELHRRIPDSFVFDPENAGYYIRRNVPRAALKGDFQDYGMWRGINYAMLKYIYDEFDGTIIVPMTIVNPAYFREIAGRLREDGADVRHFALCAPKEVLLRRLRSRGDGKDSWPALQLDRCIAGLSDETFREHIATEAKTVSEVAETIAARLNIALQPDTRSRLEKAKDRLATQIRHIRFFQ